jgi:hypothetical protein
MGSSLPCHPRRNASERAVWLQDDHEFDTPVLELPTDQHALAESGMKSVVDPPFNQVFVGSMSPFRTRPGSP